MGQGQSRAADEDLFIVGGVRVTQGLLEQLEGKPRRPRAPPAQVAAAASSQSLRPAAADAEAAADAMLARALAGSRRVGGMLLKAEAEELARVDALAEELVASEYAAPRRPRPCQQQADDCVRCYAEHAADPLACSAAVDAYSQCARAAWQEAAARASGP